MDIVQENQYLRRFSNKFDRTKAEIKHEKRVRNIVGCVTATQFFSVGYISESKAKDNRAFCS